MKQSQYNSEHTSESHSAINTLSIFTKKSSNLHRSDSNTSSDKMVPQTTLQQQSSITDNPKGYNLIECLIAFCSVLGKYLFIEGAGFTLLVTRNYYVLEILLNANSSDHRSLLQAFKIYSFSLIVVILIQIFMKVFSQKSQLAQQLSQYLYKSVSSLLVLLPLCFYLLFMTKQSTNKKNLLDKTFAKISHFIAWFIVGSITSLAGILVGAIFSTNSFQVYGKTIIFLTYVMVLSSILQKTIGTKIDIFDIIG